MRILLLGSVFFLAGFLLHWLLWRIRVPSSANTSLLGVFFTALCACFLLVYLVEPLRQYSPRDMWEYFQVSLFYVSMTLSYIVAYSALEGDSPTTSMVKFVELSGESGRTREEFSQIITNDLSIDSRISAMLQSSLVVRNGEKLKLTPQGVFWQKVFYSWMQLLDIPKGG